MIFAQVSSRHSPYGNSAKRNDLWYKIGEVTESYPDGYKVDRIYRKDKKWWADISIFQSPEKAP
jgi:hypothetical protein